MTDDDPNEAYEVVPIEPCKTTGRTLRVYKWRYLPELPDLTLRDLVGLKT